MYTRKTHLCARRAATSVCLCLHSSAAQSFVDFSSLVLIIPKSYTKVKQMRARMCIKIYIIFPWRTQHIKRDISYRSTKFNEFHFKCLFPSLCSYSAFLCAVTLFNRIAEREQKACKQLHFRDDRFWFTARTGENEINYTMIVCTKWYKRGIHAINYQHFIEFCYDFSHNTHTSSLMQFYSILSEQWQFNK